jgi:uncharacterized protein
MPAHTPPNADRPDDVTIEATTIRTTDGLALEAEIALPRDPVAAVVLAHPHPLQGGSMRSLVTSELFRTLPAEGVAMLRFNFRGVEGSEGEHGNGRGEHADVIAAIDALAAATPARPLILAGWSFGADVSLSVLDERLAGWFLIAPPLRILEDHEFVAAADPRPKLLVVPEHDTFRPPEPAREATKDWVNTRIEVVPGADHFLVGRTHKAAKLLRAFVDEV